MPKKNPKYLLLANELRSNIQQGTYRVGDLLPSEHSLCEKYKITRTTVRKALDELQREGYITRQHGKGSIVIERRKTLGLLAVKGFSEAVGENVVTTFLQKPMLVPWPEQLPFPASENESSDQCIFFERLRGVGDIPVMLEQNWFAAGNLDGFLDLEFLEGSFFKTLSQHYLIEITGSEQELRALFADEKKAELLSIEVGAPILKISIRFSTSIPDLNIYSLLYCNTDQYPVGNIYKH